MPRNHCFVSASSDTGVQRWMWHAENANGDVVRSSGSEFASFDECAKHAFAHGYAHIEVPVLGMVAMRAHSAVGAGDGDHRGDEASQEEDANGETPAETVFADLSVPPLPALVQPATPPV